LLTIQVVANLDTIGGDPSKGFILAGTSAGAGIVAVLSHLYRDDQLSPPLRGLYLSVPTVVSPEAVPEKYKDEYTSREENKDAPLMNAKMSAWAHREFNGQSGHAAFCANQLRIISRRPSLSAQVAAALSN
jgi:acetyl esterase/lipase